MRNKIHTLAIGFLIALSLAGCSSNKAVAEKEPAANYNDETLEKVMEMTVYENSNIIREQIDPEMIKGTAISEDYLTFCIALSEEDKDFILSLANMTVE